MKVEDSEEASKSRISSFLSPFLYKWLEELPTYTGVPFYSSRASDSDGIEVARDPTSRMPFISAGPEIQTIGCSYVYWMLLWFPQWFSLHLFVIKQLRFAYQRLLILQWAKTNQHNYSACNFSCQSLTRVAASYSSYYSKHRCGLDNSLVSIATFYAITCHWSASKDHCHLLL